MDHIYNVIESPELNHLIPPSTLYWRYVVWLNHIIDSSVKFRQKRFLRVRAPNL